MILIRIWSIIRILLANISTFNMRIFFSFSISSFLLFTSFNDWHFNALQGHWRVRDYSLLQAEGPYCIKTYSLHYYLFDKDLRGFLQLRPHRKDYRSFPKDKLQKAWVISSKMYSRTLRSWWKHTSRVNYTRCSYHGKETGNGSQQQGWLKTLGIKYSSTGKWDLDELVNREIFCFGLFCC